MAAGRIPDSHPTLVDQNEIAQNLAPGFRVVTMRVVFRTSALVILLALISASLGAVDIWTVCVDNTRQGWNKFETLLTVANVPTP
jgi:hypothetical protein